MSSTEGIPTVHGREDVKVSDPNGHVRAETASGATSIASIVVALPSRAAPTPYSRFGDWFAWLCLLVFPLGVSLALLRRATGRDATGRMT